MLARTPSVQIASIQVLRAVAAFAVVVHHGLHDAAVLARRNGYAFDWQNVLPLSAGVDLFFVISGFVMVYASRNLFGRASSILPFVRRRMARIVPIYWAATIAFMIVYIGGIAPQSRPPPTWDEVAATFLFIPYLRPDGLLQPIFGLGWTLNYEMFFYLLFALALPLPRARAVAAVAGGLLLLVAVGSFIPPSLTALSFWTRPIILEFGFGVLIGHMALSGVRPTRGLAVALAFIAIGLLVAGALKPGFVGDRALLYGLPAALLVISALGVEFDGQSNWATRAAVGLGDASYALYLFHPFPQRALARVAGDAFAHTSLIALIALGALLSCLLAVLIWRFFEKPLTRALQGPRLTI
jgi:exopolysaccharide production protein ExoZ